MRRIEVYLGPSVEIVEISVEDEALLLEYGLIAEVSEDYYAYYHPWVLKSSLSVEQQEREYEMLPRIHKSLKEHLKK